MEIVVLQLVIFIKLVDNFILCFLSITEAKNNKLFMELNILVPKISTIKGTIMYSQPEVIGQLIMVLNQLIMKGEIFDCSNLIHIGL